MTTRLIATNKDISNKDIELNNNLSIDTLRIGIDTTLWDILKADVNIVWFSRICGFTYEYDNTKSLLVNILYRLWFVLLICFTIIGFIGYIYNFISIIDPRSTCSSANSIPRSTSFSIFVQLFFVSVIDPFVQLLSIIFSFSCIKKLFLQIEDKDSLHMYQSSLKGSKLFYNTMNMNVIIIWLIIVWYYHGDSCSLGSTSMMTFFDISSTCYTSFAVFIISAMINRITAIQEEILHHAKEGTLTLVTYLNEKHKVHGLYKIIYFSSQILVITAIVNVVSWIFCYVNLGILTPNPTILQDLYYMYTDSAFFLKELIFSIYIAWQSVKINNLSSDLCNVLGTNSWLSTDGNLEKELLRLSLYVCVKQDPISFKILGKKITKSDIVAYIISIISAFFGKIIQKAIKN